VHASGYLRRLLAAGTVGVALLAVTALGTGGSAGDGSGATGLAYLLPAAIAAVALLVGLVVWGDRPLTKLARFVLHVMALSAPLIVLGLLAAAAMREQRRVAGVPRKPVPQVPAPLATVTPPPLQTATPAPAGGGSGTTPVWVALAALALVSGAAVLVAGRRGRRPAVPRLRRRAREPAEPEPAWLGDPAAIADPRASIIAAFAWLEAELRAAGMARRRGEGPIEYTERVAAARPDLAQPVRRLARAYAPARFSEHPVDAPMRRDALVALDAVRHALAPEPVA
jgi:hypothetical protein